MSCPFRHVFALLLLLLLAAPWQSAGAEAPLSRGDAEELLRARGLLDDGHVLVHVWNERINAGWADGFLIEHRASGKRSGYYALGGALLEEDQARTLGLGAKPWDQARRAAGHAASSTSTKAAAPPPWGLTLALGPMPEIVLPPMDAKALAREDAALGLDGTKGLTRIGVFRDLPLPAGPALGNSGADEWETVPGGRVWRHGFSAQGALGIRLALAGLQVPEGGRLLVYGLNTGEVHGPIEAPPGGEDPLWSPACFDESIVLECFVPGEADAAAFRVSVERLIHIYPQGMKAAFAKAAGSCNNDATCYPAWADAAAGVAGLGTIGNAGYLWCTGSLLADNDPFSDEPLFLTANHCVRDQSSASSLEFYWFYQSSVCDGAVPSPAAVPRTTGGADYLAGSGGTGYDGGGNDFTLLRLRNEPPAGTYYNGWTTSVPSLGTEVRCIHHPRGDFKRFSLGTLTNDGSHNHPTLYHQVIWYDGTTEPGSSGSPMFLADTQEIIGQLWGGTASCSLQDDPDFYGRFDVTFPVIAGFLSGYSIEFASLAQEVDEGVGAAEITLTLNKPAGGTGISVAYSAAAGTAQGGSDFVITSGVVSFPANALTTSFEVQITDDTHTETSETVTLSLSAPTLASLGLGNTAVLTISDNDPDTDGDGLSDYDETNAVFGFLSLPGAADSDGDGLSDSQEVFGETGYVTNPMLIDTDGDGLPDDREIAFGFDPTDPASTGALSSMPIPWFSSR